MFNLLPFAQKKEIKREYHRRIFIVALLHVIFAEVILIALLVPAIILERSREVEFKTQLEHLNLLTAEEQKGSFATFLKETTEKLAELSPEKNSTHPSDAVLLIARMRTEGIRISAIEYQAGDNFKKGTLRVDGKAVSREALLSFRKALEQQSHLFTKVDLPISNFALEKDIPFSIGITAQFASEEKVEKKKSANTP